MLRGPRRLRRTPELREPVIAAPRIVGPVASRQTREIQTIELPFLRVESVVIARLVRLGRLYGRAAAQFTIEVSGRMPHPGRRTGEMAGRGTAWVDLATGITLESVIDSDAVAYDTDIAPVFPFHVKEERRLDQQMSRF